eukprot:scaffold3765_cov122-Isochrysis_galbana.AAC.9
MSLHILLLPKKHIQVQVDLRHPGLPRLRQPAKDIGRVALERLYSHVVIPAAGRESDIRAELHTMLGGRRASVLLAGAADLRGESARASSQIAAGSTAHLLLHECGLGDLTCLICNDQAVEDVELRQVEEDVGVVVAQRAHRRIAKMRVGEGEGGEQP